MSWDWIGVLFIPALFCGVIGFAGMIRLFWRSVQGKNFF